jgi:F0F1-type ATP synthase assembly protein I
MTSRDCGQHRHHAQWEEAVMSQEHEHQAPQHPNYMALCMMYGMMLGAGLGLVIGIALDNIALGIPLGAGAGMTTGLSLGTALDQRNKDDNVRRDRKKMDQKGAQQ